MLVLTRRIYERVFIRPAIGPEIVLEVNAIQGNRVRLSFDAPGDVTIVREEIDGDGQADDAQAAALEERQQRMNAPV